MGTWLARFLVVPGAHVRIGDFQFQAELYDVFHLGWASRLGHMLCTPIVILGAFVALGAIPLSISGPGLADAPALSIVLAGGLCAYFFGLDAFTGLVTTPVVAGLLAASVAITRAAGDDAWWVGVVLMVVAAIVQAGSHLFEDVPPPWGNERTWKPLREVMRELTARRALELATLTLVSFALEWWASFRILGLQMNFVAMRLGLRPELTKLLEARREQILRGEG